MNESMTTVGQQSDLQATDSRLHRRLGNALRPLLALGVLAVSIAAFAAPADAVVARPSGVSEYGSDLQCGNGTVLEGLALATDAAPGQTAWQVTEILVHRNGDWSHHGWSEYRHARVNGFGTAGPYWTPQGTNFTETMDVYQVPHGWVALRQWVYADSEWTFRAPIASSGYTICHA
jgi:hypothetical protein